MSLKKDNKGLSVTSAQGEIRKEVCKAKLKKMLRIGDIWYDD